MTAYDDVPKVTALHGEQERVTSAIDMIDAGGTMASFVVAPPAPPPGGIMPTTMMMAQSITVGSTPLKPETLAALRGWLVQRSADIDAELAALGVTDAPARQ